MDFTTAVSLEANLEYRAALKLVAAQKGITVAKLVRRAIDTAFGEDLEAALIFRANAGLSIEKSDNESNNNG